MDKLGGKISKRLIMTLFAVVAAFVAIYGLVARIEGTAGILAALGGIITILAAATSYEKGKESDK